MRSSRRWKFRSLVVAWIVYWILLVVVKLGPATRAVWRATHGAHPPDTSSVALNFSNFDFVLKVTSPSGNWTGSAHLLSIAGWIAVPPLLLWLVWLTQQPRPVVTEDELREQV